MNDLESIPKYLIVKKTIISNIDNGIYHPGEMLPSERELIESLNVSRITVRRALSELEDEGYIYRVQGKGSYVKGEQNRQDLFSLTSCTQDIIRLGMTPSRHVIDMQVMKADKKRQNELQLNDNEKVFHLERVYLADDQPINLTSTYLPYKYLEGIEKFDFSKLSLYDVLENKYNIRIKRATRFVEAVLAHDEVCELLDVQNNVPLILFRCIIYGEVNGKETPIETFKCYYRSDRFSFCINQVR